MVQSFFDPRRRVSPGGPIGRYAPQGGYGAGDGIAALFDAVGEIVGNKVRRRDNKVATQLRPQIEGRLEELAIELDTDPASYLDRATDLIDTMIGEGDFLDPDGFRQEMLTSASNRATALMTGRARALDEEQAGLNLNRRRAIEEDAVVASRAGDMEGFEAAVNAHREVTASAVAEGWISEADAEIEANRISHAVTTDRMIRSVEDAYAAGGMDAARAAADRIQGDQSIELPLEMRAKAARIGLSRAGVLEKEARARAAETRSERALQSKLAEEHMKFQLEAFLSLGDDPWPAFYEQRPYMTERQAAYWEQRLALSSRQVEDAEDENLRRLRAEYEKTLQDADLDRLENLYAAGVYTPEDIGPMIADGRLPADEGVRRRMVEAYNSNPEIQAVGELASDVARARNTAAKVSELLSGGYRYTYASGDQLDELATFAEVVGIVAGEADPAEVARQFGALPPNMAEQVRMGLSDPTMAEWAGRFVNEVRAVYGDHAAGVALGQIGKDVAPLIEVYEQRMRAFAPGTEEAAETWRQVQNEVGDRPRSEGLADLIEQEEPYIRQQLERRFLAEANGWREWFRQRGLMSGVDGIAMPPAFTDAFELALSDTLRQMRHPSNQPIPEQAIDMAFADVAKVWGPTGAGEIVPYPVRRYADRLAQSAGAPAGLDESWVYEQAYVTFKNALTTQDSPTYIDEELTIQEFVEMVRDRDVELRTTDVSVLQRGGVPPVEVWVRTRDGRSVPVGGFEDTQTFEPSWNDGRNGTAQLRLSEVRQAMRRFSAYVPGLDDQETALIYNLLSSGSGLEDFGRWARKDIDLLKSLDRVPGAVLGELGRVGDLFAEERRRRIGEVE